MFRSLKAKFTLAFGTLIILLFVGLGAFLLDAKARELSDDIAFSTQAFSQFTVSQVIQGYEQFLEPGNFLPFNRDMQVILRRNKDVSSLSVASYAGLILYDSAEETEQAYEGTLRTIGDQGTLDRVQAQLPSLLLEDGRVLYVKVGEEESEYVNFNEEAVEPLSSRDRIVNIVVPYQNAYAVFYELDYSNLDARLQSEQMQIALAALVGVILALMLSFMLSVSITNPLKELKKGALQIAGGDFDVQLKLKSKDEVGVLAKTFNKMAKDLKASTQAMLYKERVQKELELAAQIQEGLLPEEKFELNKMDMSGGLVPATEIGGDAFDYIAMDENRYLCYLGDVTGHGVAAGIISSVTNAVLYGLRQEKDLKAIVRKLSDVIQEKTTPNVFVTMALTLWDESKSTLTYSNAGHPPILYYDAAKKKVTEIRLQGMALGLADLALKSIQEETLTLNSDDVVVMYSDGIPEAGNERGEQYGLQRLKRIVQDAANDLYTADGIKNAVLADVVEHIGGQEHADDMTVVVLKRKKD